MATTNNYYYSSDSHNVITTSTNYYLSMDGHNTTSVTNIYASVSTSIGNHDISLNSTVGAVSDLVHDVLHTSLLNNVGVGDVLSTALATSMLDSATTTIGDVLSTNVSDLAHSVGVSDLLNGSNLTTNVSTIAGDLLSHVDVGDALSNTISGNATNADMPVVGSVLDDVGSGDLNHITDATSVGDIVSHLGNVDLSDIVSNFPATAETSIGDTLSHIGDVDVGSVSGIANGAIGDIVANIASSVTGSDFGDLLHNVGSVDLSHVGAALDVLPVVDLVTSNLDLDHLTSNLNLFDVGHGDVSVDTHQA